jgi:hypothetical protein
VKRVILRQFLPCLDLRLGRHVHHDSESRRYAFDVSGLSVAAVRHTRHVPVFDQGNLGSCFPPGTRVRIADGSERPIEDVRLGECVVTAEGRTGRVVRTLLRDEDSGLVRLKLWGHTHLRMTREHPVLTARGYIKAAELRIGDEVAMPKYISGTNEAVVVADHVTQPSHRLVRGNRWQGLPGRRGLNATAHQMPEKIQLDENFGRVIGLFLAEGNCDSGKVNWSFHINETDTLVAELVERLSVYGISAHVRPLPIHKGCKVIVHGTGWTRLLSSLCGNGSGLKRLHPDLAGGPREFLAAVLSGWLDGDGTTRKDGSPEGVSISQDLIMGMYDIAQALGRHPVVATQAPITNSAAKTRRPRWTLTMAPGMGRCRQDDTHVWRKVRALEIEDYVGPVYDLTVEGDHSYVAEGVGVHNCTGNAAVGCLATGPFYGTLTNPVYSEDEAGAVACYSAATRIDGYGGEYPPTDTGSDGLTVAKVLQQAGEISGYQHTFSLDDALKALQTVPLITGVDWFDDMFNPSSEGLLSASGQYAGGHEIVVDEYDPVRGWVGFTNSWGAGWGVAGRFYLQAEDWGRLLAQQGDVTVFVPANQPAPQPTPEPGGQADVALATAARPWVNQRHVGGNKVMANKLKAWLVDRGL